MRALIRVKGQQLFVGEGETCRAPLMDTPPGESVKLDQVLALGEGENLRAGTPFVKGASVTAKVLEHKRDRKIEVFHFKRRKKHRKMQGHREHYTLLQIEKIKMVK